MSTLILLCKGSRKESHTKSEFIDGACWIEDELQIFFLPGRGVKGGGLMPTSESYSHTTGKG